MILVEWTPKPNPLYMWSRDGTKVLGLQWSRREPGLKLEWKGPKGLSVTATSQNTGEVALAAIIGPQGIQGRDGSPGPQGVAGRTELPDTLDGGNF